MLIRTALMAATLILTATLPSNSAAAATVTFYTDRSAFDAAVTSSSTIGFEGLVATNSYFTQNTPLVVDNVEFSVSSGFIGVAGPNVPGGTVLGAPFNTAVLFSNNSYPITADVTGAGTGFTAVGGIFGDIDSAGRTGTLTLLGTSGILETRDVVVGDMGQGQPGTFFGWTVQGDTVVSVTYSLPNLHPHYEGMDNFVYGFAAQRAVVPEPSAIALGLIGAVVVPLTRRRRAKQSGRDGKASQAALR